MGAHIEVEIPVEDKDVEEILSKKLEEQLLAPKIEIINNVENKATPVSFKLHHQLSKRLQKNQTMFKKRRFQTGLMLALNST